MHERSFQIHDSDNLAMRYVTEKNDETERGVKQLSNHRALGA